MESISGPPELPGLMAASVWIALPIWKAVSDSMLRSSAEITPTDSDCCSPNGLPIAATGSPTLRCLRGAELERSELEPARIDLEQADVGVRVVAHDLRRHAVAVGELDEDLLGLAGSGACPLVTTCALVAM